MMGHAMGVGEGACAGLRRLHMVASASLLRNGRSDEGGGEGVGRAGRGGGERGACAGAPRRQCDDNSRGLGSRGVISWCLVFP